MPDETTCADCGESFDLSEGDIDAMDLKCRVCRAVVCVDCWEIGHHCGDQEDDDDE